MEYTGSPNTYLHVQIILCLKERLSRMFKLNTVKKILNVGNIKQKSINVRGPSLFILQHGHVSNTMGSFLDLESLLERFFQGGPDQPGCETWNKWRFAATVRLVDKDLTRGVARYINCHLSCLKTLKTITDENLID